MKFELFHRMEVAMGSVYANTVSILLYASENEKASVASGKGGIGTNKDMLQVVMESLATLRSIAKVI